MFIGARSSFVGGVYLGNLQWRSVALARIATNKLINICQNRVII